MSDLSTSTEYNVVRNSTFDGNQDLGTSLPFYGVYNNPVGDYGPTSTTKYERGLLPGEDEFVLIITDTDYEYQLFPTSEELVAYYNNRFGTSLNELGVQTAIADSTTQGLIARYSYTASTSDEVMGNYKLYEVSNGLNNVTQDQVAFGVLHNQYSEMRNEGMSVPWVSMESGKTVYYACPYPGTDLKKVDTNGTTTTIQSSNSNPTRGSFTSGNAGEIYYANKPFHLLPQGNQNAVTTMANKNNYFGHFYTRNTPQTAYLYGVNGDANVQVWLDKYACDGTLSQSFSVPEEEVVEVRMNDNSSTPYFFISDIPIVATVRGSGGDKMILPQVNQGFTYGRTNQIKKMTNGSSFDSSGDFYIEAATGPDKPTGGFGMSIADGSGGDSEASLPLACLSKNYCVGRRISSLHIIAVEADTDFRIRYNGHLGSWEDWDAGTLAGSSQPGASAVYSTGSSAGSSTNLASNADMWWIECTKPVCVTINDDSNDEEVLWGYCNTSSLSTVFQKDA